MTPSDVEARRIPPPAPPGSEAELARRAASLSGLSLGELAGARGVPVPPDLRRAKGWVGQLIERALGATARSRAAPDFEALGIELKTLPVARDGTPCESTFVCTIDLVRIGEVDWERSLVRQKLARVLWVPVEGSREIAVGARRIGAPLLWSPSPEDEAALRFDWEELAGLIGRGDVERISGHLGRYLQVRPKARDSRARRRGVDTEGAAFAALPRGFYLRAAFTGRIVRQHYALEARHEGG
jgi:DNA mismatch repair protein MutH